MQWKPFSRVRADKIPIGSNLQHTIYSSIQKMIASTKDNTEFNYNNGQDFSSVVPLTIFSVVDWKHIR